MSQSHSSWSDLPSFTSSSTTPPLSTSSISRVMHTHLKVTLVHRPSRTTSFCSVFNSVEDARTTLVSSEVDEPQSTGMEGWRAEERSKPLQGFITLQEKILRHIHLTVRAQGDLLQHTHTNGSRAETQDAYRRDISQVKEYELNNRKSEISSNSEQMNQSNENWQLHHKLSESEFHTGLLLEEQRNQIFSEAKSARNMQGVKGGTIRLCHPRIEQTNSFPSRGNLPYKSGM